MRLPVEFAFSLLTELCHDPELRKIEIVMSWITADLAPGYCEETLTKDDCVLHMVDTLAARILRHVMGDVTRHSSIAARPRLDRAVPSINIIYL
jgi:hypothetical protein